MTLEILKNGISSLRPVRQAVQGYARNNLSGDFTANSQQFNSFYLLH
jgi:hypothetical protein